ncbi:MAG: DUF1592 domain-containing protein, partial [Myxococcaceae bacterium]|nr:DUF1592 domain-containing protein [Myxococcaceae bacterium]
MGRTFRFQCDDLAKRGGSSAVRRLTRTEYENTLTDTFGATAVQGASTALSLVFADPITESVRDFRQLHDDQLVVALVDSSIAVASQAVAAPATFARLSGPCRAPAFTQPYSGACLDELVRSTGRLLWRRPLADAEVQSYRAMFDAARTDADVRATPREQVELVLAALMQAPEVLFQLPAGAVGADGRFQVDAFTVAARLSYQLTSAPPDEALRLAADQGLLGTREQLKAQALRLVDSPRGRARVRELASFWWAANRAPRPHTAVAANAQVDAARVLEQAVAETQAFAEHVFYAQPATFTQMMTSDAVFPATAELAKLLGVQRDSGAVRAPSRRGVLTRPAFLLGKGDRPSPILRGAHVRTHLLCDDLPAPPANADEVAMTNTAMLDRNTLTSRQ